MATDKELAKLVRDMFNALRQAIDAAERAGLHVSFSDRLTDLLFNPEMSLSDDLRIMRPL